MDSYRPVLAATVVAHAIARAQSQGNHGYEARPCRTQHAVPRRGLVCERFGDSSHVFLLLASVLQAASPLFGAAAAFARAHTAESKICSAAISITPAASAAAPGPRPQR